MMCEHCSHIHNTSTLTHWHRDLTDNSPAALSLSAVPVIQLDLRVCATSLPVKCCISTAEVEVQWRQRRWWLLVYRAGGAVIPRCARLSAPLLWTDVTAAPPSSSTHSPRFRCRWLMMIYSDYIRGQDVVCRTQRRKAPPSGAQLRVGVKKRWSGCHKEAWADCYWHYWALTQGPKSSQGP